MKKLPLPDLMPYLAHDVKYAFRCIYDHENDYEAVLGIDDPDAIYSVINYSEYFLILRPMSDLHKKVNIDGEMCSLYDKFKSVVSAKQWRSICDLILNNTDYRKWCDMPYWFVRLLHRYHFDTEGLIEQGFAIDINKIPK